MSEKKDVYMDIFEKYGVRMKGKSLKWYIPGNSKYVDNKIKRFIRNYFVPVEWGDIMAYLDTSVFKTGKEGLLITTEGIFVKEPLEKIYYLEYAKIQSVGYHIEVDEAGREKSTIEVIYTDGRVRRVLDYYFDQHLFVKYLEAAVELAQNGNV